MRRNRNYDEKERNEKKKKMEGVIRNKITCNFFGVHKLNDRLSHKLSLYYFYFLGLMLDIGTAHKFILFFPLQFIHNTNVTVNRCEPIIAAALQE